MWIAVFLQVLKLLDTYIYFNDMLASSQFIYELDFKSSLKPVMQGGAPKSEDNLIGNSSLFPTKVRSKTSMSLISNATECHVGSF